MPAGLPPVGILNQNSPDLRIPPRFRNQQICSSAARVPARRIVGGEGWLGKSNRDPTFSMRSCKPRTWPVNRCALTCMGN